MTSAGFKQHDGSLQDNYDVQLQHLADAGQIELDADAPGGFTIRPLPWQTCQCTNPTPPLTIAAPEGFLAVAGELVLHAAGRLQAGDLFAENLERCIACVRTFTLLSRQCQTDGILQLDHHVIGVVAESYGLTEHLLRTVPRDNVLVATNLGYDAAAIERVREQQSVLKTLLDAYKSHARAQA